MMGSVELRVSVARSPWGWRGSLVVPTRAGEITLASEVPADAVRALRRALGPRGAEDMPEETAGFLPLLGVLGTVYKLARRHGPVVLRAFRKYGPRVLTVLRRQGIKGLLRLVRGGAGGLVQSAVRRALSGDSVPSRDAGALAGALAMCGALEAMPFASEGVRQSAELAGRIVDASVAARMGDPRADAWLARCRMDPRCAPALGIASELVR